MKRRKIYENKETDSAFTVHRNDAGLPDHRGMGAADPLALPSTPTATLNVTVDGAPLTVTNYKVVYVANPVPVKSDASNFHL